MAKHDTTIAGKGYGNIYIDALVWGKAGWNTGSGPVTYWFGASSDKPAIGAPNGGRVDGWSAAEKAAFETAIANYEAVCGLDFQQAASAQSADIVWWQVPSSYWGDDGTLGEHEIPDGTSPHKVDGQIWGYFGYEETASWNYLKLGGDGYNTVIHELGHAVGLAHPFDGGDQPDATIFPGSANGGVGRYGQNQGPFTVMSYNPDWTGQPRTSEKYGSAASLSAFDIAALQAMYGVNTTHRTGADTYKLPGVNAEGTGWICIWDAGGKDTISFAGQNRSARIDLREAPLTGESAGGYISNAKGIQGGFTIANGATIEIAIGGNKADTLVGNAASNRLEGNGGADSLTGGGGRDVFVFTRNEAEGDRILDFDGNGKKVGDKLVFEGYGADAYLQQVDATRWEITLADETAVDVIIFQNRATLHHSDVVFA